MGVKGRGGGCGSRKIARKSLDELMGKDRNRPLSEVQRRRSHFSDDEFCKHYLTGFCPYTLFTNTKSDLGTCKLEHSSAMQEMWDKISPMDKATYRYEDNMQSFLEECVREVDRTIALRKRESAHKMDLIVPDADLTEQRDLMERNIHEMTDKQDYLNEEGRFDEARAVMLQIESLQEDVKRKTKDIDDTMQREKMKVLGTCDVCGCKLELADETADARHLVGKQHVGYELIRARLAELREGVEARRKLRQEFRDQQEKERDAGKDGERTKEKSEAKDGEKRDRDYDRYRF